MRFVDWDFLGCGQMSRAGWGSGKGGGCFQGGGH